MRMAANTAIQIQARSKPNPKTLESPAVDYATRLIHQVCCLAGSFDLIERFSDERARMGWPLVF